MAARLPSRCAREAAGSHRRAALRNSCVMNRCLTRGALNCRSLSRCPSPSSHHLVSAYQSLTRHLCPLPTPCMSSASQLLYTEPCSIVLSIGFHHPNPRCRDCPLNRLTAPSSLSAPSTQHTMLVGKDLRGGELLMASRPLAIVLASPPQAPETTELLRELAVRCFSPAEQQVLEALRSQSVTQGGPIPPEFSQLHTGPQQQSQQSPRSSSSGFAARHSSLLMRSAEFSHLATCCEEEEQQGKERDESSSPLPSGQLLEGGSAWAASSSMRHSRRPPPARSSSDRVSGRGSVFSSYGRKGGASVGGGAAAGTASGARRVSAVQQFPFHQTSASLSMSLTGTIVSGSMLSSNGRSGPQSTSADALMRDLASMRAIGRAGAQCTVYQVMRGETS